MIFPPSVIEIIWELAKAKIDLEVCGFIVQDGDTIKVVEAKNCAEKPDRHWLIHHSEIQRIRLKHEKIVCVWHTHPTRPPVFSNVDLAGIETSALPHLVLSSRTGEWNFKEPDGYRLPYKGRAFIHGFMDCFTLVRDWYRWEKGIELPDVPRDHEWWNKGQDLYMQHFKGAGFAVVSTNPLDALPGDGVAIRLRSDKWNHSAIYIGQNRILHHRPGVPSDYEFYGQYWQHRTLFILRHKDLC